MKIIIVQRFVRLRRSTERRIIRFYFHLKIMFFFSTRRRRRRGCRNIFNLGRKALGFDFSISANIVPNYLWITGGVCILVAHKPPGNVTDNYSCTVDTSYQCHNNSLMVFFFRLSKPLTTAFRPFLGGSNQEDRSFQAIIIILFFYGKAKTT